MKRKAFTGVALILLGFVASYWFQQSKANITGIPKSKSPIGLAEAPAKTSTNVSAAPPGGRSTSSAPHDNLKEMAETLATYTKPGVSLGDLIAHLESTRQKPVVTRDANEFTGELHIVRTRKPLSGTRYFHAQYFTNDDGQAFIQHMSVEFKGAPTAMTDAVSAMQKAFGLPSPPIARDGYARWPLGEGHILWVKRLTEEDLQDDPFNAYSTADIGTVRVAIEAEIH